MSSFRPPAKCDAKDSAAWLTYTATEIRAHLEVLDNAGWTQSRIAFELGCSERSIQEWSKGTTDMRASKFRRLEALAAGFGKALPTKTKVG